MIVAHLSDLHLGFRAYGRIERGVDMRERDVAAAFERALQELVSIGPDLVVVAGDIFDRPDPPPGAVVALARGLELLRSSLPAALVLMVAGPRDTPRRPGDPGALAVLDTFPNVEAATGLTRSIMIESLDLHACLVPYRAAVGHPPPRPESDPRMKWNVLVLHGVTDGQRDAGVHIDPEEWSYVALGGEHRRRVVHRNVQYSGALERVALDPWAEAGDEKGFVTVDLESGGATFHSIPGRPVAALAPIKVVAGDHDRVRRRVREVIDEVPGGIDGKIVRLRLEGADPQDLLALQGDQLSELRRAALHLAVEAGPEPRVVAAASLPADAHELLRATLEPELERDGLLNDDTRAILERVVGVESDDSGWSGPIGVIDALDGDIPGLGRVSTSIPPGLTAVIGADGRARRAVTGLLISAGGPPEHDVSLRWLWAGREAETLESAVAAARAVVMNRGLAIVDEALARVGENAPGPTNGASAVASGSSTPADRDRVATEFRSADRDLRALRADVVEVDGDLEASTMGWLRERQDAETSLNAYRDRARELRARLGKMENAGPDAPCPTCGRVLEAHYKEVLRELQDEWESIVQDGSWWKSRWEQLELKPPTLQELEGTSLRMHATLEASAERVELLRARLAAMSIADAEVSGMSAVVEGDALGHVKAALSRVRAARETRATDLLLDRGSRFVCRITGSRILAITLEDGRVRLHGDLGVLTPTSEEDLSAARVAIRLAAASLVAAEGRVLGSIVLEEPFDRLNAEARIRALVLMKELLRLIPRIILVSNGEAVDARPEMFDCILEVRDEASGFGAALRPAAAGPGRAVLKAPVKPAADTATFRIPLSS